MTTFLCNRNNVETKIQNHFFQSPNTRIRLLFTRIAEFDFLFYSVLDYATFGNVCQNCSSFPFPL